VAFANATPRLFAASIACALHIAAAFALFSLHAAVPPPPRAEPILVRWIDTEPVARPKPQVAPHAPPATVLRPSVPKKVVKPEAPKPAVPKPFLPRSDPPPPSAPLVAASEAPLTPNAAVLQPPAEVPPAAASVLAPGPASAEKKAAPDANLAALGSAPPAQAAPAPVSPPRFDAAYLRNPAPAYPRQSRQMGETGRVILRVLVTPLGAPGRVELRTSSGSYRLDDAALDAVQRWKFVPARQGDKPVEAWVLVPILFTLEG